MCKPSQDVKIRLKDSQAANIQAVAQPHDSPGKLSTTQRHCTPTRECRTEAKGARHRWPARAGEADPAVRGPGACVRVPVCDGPSAQTPCSQVHSRHKATDTLPPPQAHPQQHHVQMAPADCKLPTGPAAGEGSRGGALTSFLAKAPGAKTGHGFQNSCCERSFCLNAVFPRPVWSPRAHWLWPQLSSPRSPMSLSPAHFTDVGTEAQRASIPCPGSRSW